MRRTNVTTGWLGRLRLRGLSPQSHDTSLTGLRAGPKPIPPLLLRLRGLSPQSQAGGGGPKGAALESAFAVTIAADAEPAPASSDPLPPPSRR